MTGQPVASSWCATGNPVATVRIPELRPGWRFAERERFRETERYRRGPCGRPARADAPINDQVVPRYQARGIAWEKQGRLGDVVSTADIRQ
jgi:hypothetical protein